MKIAPFTKSHALKLMRKFADFKNKNILNNGNIYRVRIVTMIPFNNKDKHHTVNLFFKAFNGLISVDEPMNYILYHPSDEFDICIVATREENGGISVFTLPIATLVSDNGEVELGFKVDIV